jgi:hypothetical protein
MEYGSYYASGFTLGTLGTLGHEDALRYLDHDERGRDAPPRTSGPHGLQLPVTDLDDTYGRWAWSWRASTRAAE